MAGSIRSDGTRVGPFMCAFATLAHRARGRICESGAQHPHLVQRWVWQSSSIFATGGEKKKFTAIILVFARKYEHCSFHGVVISCRWSRFNIWTESVCLIFFHRFLLWIARVASVSVARELTNMMVCRLSVGMLVLSVIWDYFSGKVRH